MRLLDKFKKKGFESENVKPENSEEIIVDRFPFADAPNTACFNCRHVLEEHKPILYVSHDEDGYWQFLCGGSHKEEDARVVSLVCSITSLCFFVFFLHYIRAKERHNGKCVN